MATLLPEQNEQKNLTIPGTDYENYEYSEVEVMNDFAKCRNETTGLIYDCSNEFSSNEVSEGIVSGTVLLALLALIVLTVLAIAGWYCYDKHRQFTVGVHEEEQL